MATVYCALLLVPFLPIGQAIQWLADQWRKGEWLFGQLAYYVNLFCVLYGQSGFLVALTTLPGYLSRERKNAMSALTMLAPWSRFVTPQVLPDCADCDQATRGNAYRALDLERIDRLITGKRGPSSLYRCCTCHENHLRQEAREEAMKENPSYARVIGRL